MRTFIALLLTACSYTFDSSKPEVTLVGTPVDLLRMPRLNHNPVRASLIVTGADNKYWLAMEENDNRFRVIRLEPPEAEEDYMADSTVLTETAFYLVKSDVSGVTVTIRSAGEAGPGSVFTFPPGQATLFPSPKNDAFAYWTPLPDTTSYQLIRRDGSFKRIVPFPKGIDPTRVRGSGGFFRFSDDGALFFDRDIGNSVVAHSTTSEQDKKLGAFPNTLLIDDYRRQLLVCVPMFGFLGIPWDGVGQHTYDSDCEDLIVDWEHNYAYYSKVGDGTKLQLFEVPLDMSVAPMVVPGFENVVADRPMAFGPQGQVAYSRDAANKYVGGAGDGWLGGWRFMERGGDVSFSVDGSRVRWLEHAAKLNGVGDLSSAPINGLPIELAKNVTQYDELEDGRVLAIANHATTGVQNRLIAIDEAAKVAYHIADGASAYEFIPDSDQVLIDVVSGATGRDIIRMSIPAKP